MPPLTLPNAPALRLRRWFPEQARKAPRKLLAHTALSDIRESIEELEYYRKSVFKDPRTMK